jgi:hypothetical protein
MKNFCTSANEEIAPHTASIFGRKANQTRPRSMTFVKGSLFFAHEGNEIIQASSASVQLCWVITRRNN